jgi:glycosyltransferase involved in cell wall biosynthesis
LDRDASGLGVRTFWIEDLVREISPFRDLRAFFELYSRLREESPAVVHTHSSKAGILGRLAAWLAGVPVIIHTFHGFGFHEGQPFKGAAVALERLAAGVCARLVFVSKANMLLARGLGIGSEEKYRLIRSGVPLSRFPAKADRRAKRGELGLPKDCLLVLGVGNLKPQKNAGDFLTMAADVAGRVPEACFAYVGDGPMRPSLEAAAAARGLAGRVRFCGWRRDVGELLAAADVFVLTSLWEGLPRALVEAMKTGLACAAYPVDGIEDVLADGETGLAAPPRDAARLAAAVERLLKDPGLRRRLGEKARSSIGLEFDIDEMVRQQERLYDECLTEKR